MAALPRLVVLKSNKNDKYLQYIHEPEVVDGFLQFSGDEPVSKYTKFEIEKAKCGEDFVHIKCSYNHMYWVRSAPDQSWIVARAAKPQEDRSLWSCTLFKSDPVEGGSGDQPTKVRFCHVQLGNYACLKQDDPPPYGSCLFARSPVPDPGLGDVVTVIDWGSLFLTLPKHVAFRGDNDKYLSARWIEENPHLQFASDGKGDPTVRNEVFNTSDNCIRIKSDHFGKFWRLSQKNWICPDHSDETTDENHDTVFWPVKVSDNVFALKNMGNNLYCQRLTAEGKTDCLNAAASTIVNEARLEFHYL